MENVNNPEKLYSSLIEAIFRSSASPMVLFQGPEFVIELTNPSYQSLLPGRTIQNLPLFEAMPELLTSSLPTIMQSVFETGVPVQVENQSFLVKTVIQGEITEVLEERFFNGMFTRIDTPLGFGILNHAIETTAVVKKTRELEKALVDLSHERDLREQFVVTLTHDLRTALTATKMAAQILHRKAEDPKAVRKLSGRIAESVDRADQMIQDLLDSNRIRAGELLSLNRERCRLNGIISETLEGLSNIHGDRFVWKAGAEFEGHWSGKDLRRLVENLCNNAVKYGAPFRPIKVTLSDLGAEVEITVHNEGPPIPQADLITLFDPFIRTASAQAGKERGWGLGLTLVKGIAEAHQGSVRVESSEKSGTLFTVRIARLCAE